MRTWRYDCYLRRTLHWRGVAECAAVSHSYDRCPMLTVGDYEDCTLDMQKEFCASLTQSRACATLRPCNP